MYQWCRRCCRRRRPGGLAADLDEGQHLLGERNPSLQQQSQRETIAVARQTAELHDLQAEISSLKFDRTNLMHQLDEAINEQDEQAAAAKRLRTAVLSLVPPDQAALMRPMPTAQLLQTARSVADRVGRQMQDKLIRAEEAQEAAEARAEAAQRQLAAAQSELATYREQAQVSARAGDRRH